MEAFSKQGQITMTKATTLLGGAWGEGGQRGGGVGGGGAVGWCGFKISDTHEGPPIPPLPPPLQDPSVALLQLMVEATQTCLSAGDVPPRSPGTDV